MPISKTRRKYNALRKAGFLPFEAIEFVRTSRMTPQGKVKVTPVPLDIPYVKEMIRDRARAFRIAKRQGVDIQDYIFSVEEMYREDGYFTPEGLPDFWQYFRSIREKAIESGDYFEDKSRRKPKLLDKGDVKSQKARYRAKKAEAKARIELEGHDEYQRKHRLP